MGRNTTVNTLPRLALGTLLIAFLFAIVPSEAKAETKAYNEYTVEVPIGYLALRSSPEFDDNNIIGKLYTDDVVRCNDKHVYSGYRHVYSPKLQKTGYVSKDYLKETRDASFVLTAAKAAYNGSSRQE